MNKEQRRERFEETVKMLNQQGQSYDSRCRFRDEYNRKCAVGLWIPDDVYELSMDLSGTVIDLIHDYSNLKEILKIESEDDEVFYSKMQRLHDSTASWERNEGDKRGIRLTERAVNESRMRLEVLDLI